MIVKNLAGLMLAIELWPATVTGQTKSAIQEPTFGVHFVFNDFYSASAIKTTSFGTALRDKQFGKIKNMSPGMAINYIQGISPFFDLTGTLSGSFLDYPFKDNTSSGKRTCCLNSTPL